MATLETHPSTPAYALVYALWLGSWETALAALASAIRSGALTTREAASHQALIAGEREFVTTYFGGFPRS